MTHMSFGGETMALQNPSMNPGSRNYNMMSNSNGGVHHSVDSNVMADLYNKSSSIFMQNIPVNIMSSTSNLSFGMSELDVPVQSVNGGNSSITANPNPSTYHSDNGDYMVVHGVENEPGYGGRDEEIESKSTQGSNNNSDGDGFRNPNNSMNKKNKKKKTKKSSVEDLGSGEEIQDLLFHSHGDGDGDGDGDEDEDDGEGEDGDGDEDENNCTSQRSHGNEADDANARPTKKRYHRHTVHQIAEMERVFKEWPHPDDKQRQALSRDLKLSARQIKFWFQNKRTQMKAQHERHDNALLRSENEKLRAENYALREAVRANGGAGPCHACAAGCSDEQQLRAENARLRDEIARISAAAATCIGCHLSGSPPGPAMSLSSPSGSCVVQFNHPSPGPAATNEGLPPQPPPPGHPPIPPSPCPGPLSESEKPFFLDLAFTSAQELLLVALAGHPLWTLANPPHHEGLAIDREIYLRKFPRASTFGPSPPGMKPESSRNTGLVIMNSTSLVETLMDVNRWVEMFPSIVSRAQVVESLSTGLGGTYDGMVQLMFAEFQLPSPLVATRESYFLRHSKRVDNMWVVVDVSIESLRGNPAPGSLTECRRRPSGCVIEELPSGYSKVTWVEHGEADTRGVHSLYQHLVSSGAAFGATRWLRTLQRQCERIASVLASNVPPGDNMSVGLVPSPQGRRSMLKLAERMTNNFCGGVSASTAHTWVTLAGSGGEDDVRVVIRKSVDDPGRPPGIVLSAATSIWLPLPPSRLFQYLRDERFRTEWDILSNTGVVEEMFHVAKGQDSGNCVSLLRVNSMNVNQSNMLILQECCTDDSCSLVVYAPVDIGAMNTVLNGGDPECVALLPSGFAILPDGRPDAVGGQNDSTTGSLGTMGGSLLTVAFQILVDHVPTARLSLGSVATVNKLITNMVARIKAGLSVGNDSNGQC